MRGVIGEAVREVREDVVNATKASPAHLTYRGVKKALERSLRRLEAAREALKKHDVSSNQVEYSILKRRAERELLPYCRREGITLIAYSPLAQGLLTDKYGPGRMPRGLQRRVWTTLQYGTMLKIASVLSALKEISEAKSEDQVKQNAEAVNVKLEDRDLRLIEEALRF